MTCAADPHSSLFPLFCHCSGGDASKWTVEFTRVSGSGAVVSPSVNVVDKNDGTYTVSYAATSAGVYDVTGTPYRTFISFSAASIGKAPLKY